MEADTKPVVNVPLIAKIGIRESQSRSHEIFRILLIWGIAFLLYMAFIGTDTGAIASMDTISDRIQPGTLLYNGLLEMDEATRSKCINSLNSTFQYTVRKKITRGIRVGLLVGLLTEFIVNANSEKPISIIARTVTYSTLLALFG